MNLRRYFTLNERSLPRRSGCGPCSTRLAVTRNAFQRIYDMIMSYGTEEFIDAKKRLIRYKFFSDETFDGDDAIFGLEIPLMRLVNFFKAAALGAAGWSGTCTVPACWA